MRADKFVTYKDHEIEDDSKCLFCKKVIGPEDYTSDKELYESCDACQKDPL